MERFESETNETSKSFVSSR